MSELKLLENINRLTAFAFDCASPKSISTIYDPFKDPLMVNATYCPTCRKPAKTRDEAICILNLGECFRCDHVRGEVQEQRAIDDWEDRGCPESYESGGDN